jgi:hypothetical protein
MIFFLSHKSHTVAIDETLLMHFHINSIRFKSVECGGSNAG